MNGIQTFLGGYDVRRMAKTDSAVLLPKCLEVPLYRTRQSLLLRVVDQIGKGSALHAGVHP